MKRHAKGSQCPELCILFLSAVQWIKKLSVHRGCDIKSEYVNVHSSFVSRIPSFIMFQILHLRFFFLRLVQPPTIYKDSNHQDTKRLWTVCLLSSIYSPHRQTGKHGREVDAIKRIYIHFISFIDRDR